MTRAAMGPGREFQFAEQDRNLLVSEARYLLVSEARGMSFIALSRNTIQDIDKAQSLLMEIVIINYKAHTGLWSLRRQHFRKYFTRTNKFYLVFCMTYLVIIVFGEEQNEWWEIFNQIFQYFFHRFFLIAAISFYVFLRNILSKLITSWG